MSNVCPIKPCSAGPTILPPVVGEANDESDLVGREVNESIA